MRSKHVTACFLTIFAVFAHRADGHASALLSPVPPMHLEGSRIFDAKHNQIGLIGVQMSGLEAIAPTDAQQQLVKAMTAFTFRVIRQRWNLNTVKLPVSPWVWMRDGQDYLAQVSGIVQLANNEGLVVALVAADNAQSGAPSNIGLPGPQIADFWAAWAAAFKENPMVVFDLYGRPFPDNVPRHVAGTHRASDWSFWRNGGTASNGQAVVGMQQLVDRIRGAGATLQLIAAPGFHDTLDFQGFSSTYYLNDPNILYEFHPYFDHALTDAQRDTNFGFLSTKIALFAGEWGAPFQEDTPSCRSLPADPSRASNTVSQLINYVMGHEISSVAMAFEPAQLISDLDTYAPTQLFGPWTCGQVLNPQPGIGGILLLYMTGDPQGFGSIAPGDVTNAATDWPGPVAPGEAVNIYGQIVGPAVGAAGQIDDSGKLTTIAGDSRVLFDGVSAPIYRAGYYGMMAQVPFEVAGKDSVTVQVFYRDIPSNQIVVQVAPAAPGLFTTASLTDVLAANEDGSPNSSSNPAVAGSVVILYATGAGQTTPAGVTGLAGNGEPHTLPVSVSIGGLNADVLFAGAAPQLVGITQINVRVPMDLAGSARAVPVGLAVGDSRNPSSLRVWVR